MAELHLDWNSAAKLLSVVSDFSEMKKSGEEINVEDYSRYSDEAKSVVLRSATLAGSIKSLIDTPLLTEEGALADESLRLTETMGVNLAA